MMWIQVDSSPVPLEKDFENYHGTKAYFDICDMAIRAALPLMETYDSAVTKAIRDDVPNMLKQLEGRDLLTSTVQRQSRMVAIFRQFDQINQAASKGDTMAVLAALKGDGIRQVAVSTVRNVRVRSSRMFHQPYYSNHKIIT